MNTYIIESENGLVKIGQSFSPYHRFNSISLCSPVQLRLVAVMIRALEGDLHREFEQYRRHNEWFLKKGAVAEFVAAHWGHGLDGPVCDWTTDWAAYRKSKKEKHREALRESWEYRRSMHQEARS